MSEANISFDRLVILLRYIQPAIETAIRNNPRAFIHDAVTVKNCTVEWTTAAEHLIELRDIIANLKG